MKPLVAQGFLLGIVPDEVYAEREVTLAPGDALYLQGAYGQGANAYTGISNYTAPYDALGAAPVGGGSFAQYYADAVLNPTTGRLELSTSFSAVASLLHYWSPAWRSAFFGSYAQIDYNSKGRNALGLLGFGFAPAGASAQVSSAAGQLRLLRHMELEVPAAAGRDHLAGLLLRAGRRTADRTG